MAEKLLVTIHNEEDAARVRATGAEVLGEYPETLLVRATDTQERDLGQAGMETAPLQAEPPVQTASARFAFSDAVAADAEAPMTLEPHRTAYFIVQLAGPVAAGWLDTVHGHGATVRGTLPGYRLVVGMLPDVVDGLRGEPFIEEITPYRPAMKLSPRLRVDVPGQALSMSALTNVDAGALAEPEPQQVEITVFAGESVEQVAAQVRAGGGVVLSAEGDTVVAQTPPEVLLTLADEQAVQAIQPHVFPEFTNDRATRIIGVPDDRFVGGGAAPLTGVGEVIGVADSGLDTGDDATMHLDLRGRVTIVSLPNRLAWFATDPPPFHDGAADRRAHGTHVASRSPVMAAWRSRLDRRRFPAGSPPNNTQRVTVPTPVAGTYELRVHAHNIAVRSAGTGAPAGAVVQDFALVVSGAVELSAPPPDAA